MSTWAGRPHLSILGGKEEDRFTQYLAELLRAPVVLSAFLKSVCGLSAIVDSQISARTQVTIPGGRPDLAIRSESLYLLCEAKVSSWLHEEQLTPYARELEQWHQAHPQGTARLFVLAPQRQVGGIVQAAERDLAGAGLDQWRPTSITWEQIAALFQGLDVEDRRLMLHLQEFAEIVTYRLGEPLRPFTLEECRQLDDPLVARSICRARLLVDLVKELLSQRGLRSAPSVGRLYDGYYLKYDGRTWWYGLWIEAWAKIGWSPVFLQLLGYSNWPLPPFPAGLPSPAGFQLDNVEYIVVPLAIRHDVELEKLADEQAEVIWRFAIELPESGSSEQQA